MRAGLLALFVLAVGLGLAVTLTTPKASFESAVEAACEGNVERLRLEIARGLDINRRQENGLTLLMCAACLGQTSSVHALIRAGADVNAVTPRNWTALMMAATNGQTDSARLLLKAGADESVATECGNTAQSIAQERGEWEFLDLLAEHSVRTRGRPLPPLVVRPRPEPEPTVPWDESDTLEESSPGEYSLDLQTPY